VDRVDLAYEDCRIKPDRRITLTTSYSYVVNQKIHTEKIRNFTSVLMLHYNGVNIPSIQNMENVIYIYIYTYTIYLVYCIGFSIWDNGIK
jgi:hypothetical protein